MSLHDEQPRGDGGAKDRSRRNHLLYEYGEVNHLLYEYGEVNVIDIEF